MKGRFFGHTTSTHCEHQCFFFKKKFLGENVFFFLVKIFHPGHFERSRPIRFILGCFDPSLYVSKNVKKMGGSLFSKKQGGSSPVQLNKQRSCTLQIFQKKPIIKGRSNSTNKGSKKRDKKIGGLGKQVKINKTGEIDQKNRGVFIFKKIVLGH